MQPFSINILFVDNQTADSQIVHESIRKAGIRHQARFCNTVDDALQILRSGDFIADLVLTEWELREEGGGLKLLCALKEHEDLRSIPVLVLTSCTDPNSIAEAYDNYANCVVCRPEDPNELAFVAHTIAKFWLKAAVLPVRARESVRHAASF